MSIANEISRISAAKSALKAAINAKGGTLTTELLDDYAAAVTALSVSSGEGETLDLSFVTARANDILAGKVGSDKEGNPVNGTIATVTASKSGNVVTVPKGYIATAQTLTVAEMAEPSVSANVVTIPVGYNKTEKGVTIPEAEIRYGRSEGGNVTRHSLSISPGYIPEEKSWTFHETDLNGINATADRMLSGTVSLDAQGDKITGNIPIVTATAVNNVVTVPVGYIAEQQTFQISGEGSVTPPAAGTMEFYKCAAVDTSAKTWDGYKAVFDAESEIWSFDAAVTSGLTFGENIVPAIGKIYNDTATITAVLYQGYPENALLINCDTLNGGRLTATNCTLSTDIKKYGTGSIKINSDGYIKLDHGAGSLTDIPWTAAHFFYADSYTGGSNVKALINNDDDSGGAFFVCIRTTGKLGLHMRGGSYYDTPDALAPGWHHIRVVHAGGGLLRTYLDGQFVLSVGGFSHNTDELFIGQLAMLADSSRIFDGYIDGIEFIPLDESTITEYSGDTAPVPAKSF